jgi:hypothetical protein
MENEFLKINKVCLQNILDINKTLASIETRGDSTITLAQVRILLASTLEQMKKDNEEIEKPKEE